MTSRFFKGLLACLILVAFAMPAFADDGDSDHDGDHHHHDNKPFCAAGEIAQYNGHYFECVSVLSMLNLPKCTVSQSITFDGTKFVCQNREGVFTMNYDGTCRHINGYTDACSCAADQKPNAVAEFWNGDCSNGYYSDGFRKTNCGVVTYQCMNSTNP